MLRLVTIDLSAADVSAFEAYEAKVLALLEKHGGCLEARLRSLDRACETHLVSFPSQSSFDAYLNDPVRQAALAEWDRCGAKSVSVEVERVK